MSRIVTALVAFSTLALPVSFACGQQIFSPATSNSTATQGDATGGKGTPQCQAAPGGSRMRNRNSAECNAVAAGDASARTEQQLTVKLDLPQPEALQCEATTSTQYSQRNTVARVTGTVDIMNCPGGSAGTFDVVARVKDESGEVKPLEFSEKWQRDDAGDSNFTNDYPIGDNVELVNVRVRNLKCTCADTAAAAPEAAATAPPN